MKDRKLSLEEFTNPYETILWLKTEILILQKENARLEKQASDAINLSVSQAMTSDKMKWDLIISGALNIPKPSEG